MTEWTKQLDFIRKKISVYLVEKNIPFTYKDAELFLCVSKNKWQAWAKGQRPSADDLQKIAAKLDLNPEWLLMGTGDPEKTATPPPAKGEITVTSKDSKDSEILRMAQYILDADHEEITPALRQKIIAFHSALLCDNEKPVARRKKGTAA